MKNKAFKITFTTLFAVGGILNNALGQNYKKDYISIQPQVLTVALTAKYSSPGLITNDFGGQDLAFTDEILEQNGNTVKKGYRYAAVSKTLKYGNYEIIKELIDKGKIEGPATGWALLAINSDDSESPHSKTIVARKKGHADVIVPISLDVSKIGKLTATANSLTTTTTRTDDGGLEQTSSIATYSHSGTEEGTIGMAFSIKDLEVFLTGAYSSIGRSMTFYSRYFDNITSKIVTDRSSINYKWIPGSGSVKGVTGSLYYDENIYFVFGGNINFSAATGKLVLDNSPPQ